MMKILKNKRKNFKLTTGGFTLVELLGVLIILAIIALITFPIIDNSIKKSQEEALERTIETIEQAAYRYSVEYDIGYSTYKKPLYLNELQKKGFLDSEIINPVDNQELSGCVLYYWDSKYSQYIFEYDSFCNLPPTISEMAESLVYDNNTCKTDGTTYQYMGGCYLKSNVIQEPDRYGENGISEHPTTNYIWYSGFLWRIMGINADGTIRMITEENITAISYNTDYSSGNAIHIKEWLNDYFYNNLKGNDIITEQTWCINATSSSTSAETTCTNNLSTTKAKVGLITLDEYNLAGGAGSYLNIKQDYWTTTPYNGSIAWGVNVGGTATFSSISSTYGVRAVINVNSDVTITGGNGTIGETWSNENGPYVLSEEKYDINITGKLNEKAISGEYVLFAGKKYRVVSIDNNGNTKLMLDDYYEETEGTPYTMAYGDDNTFTLESGIGQKLNTDVLNWLVVESDTANRNKLVTNYPWYQNNFSDGDNYKISLEETNPARTVNATVGLIRAGEMLSSQSSSILTQGYTETSHYNNASGYWTMTPYTSSSNVWNVGNGGGTAIFSSISRTFGLRAVIVVNSDVTITQGNGTWSSPYGI